MSAQTFFSYIMTYGPTVIAAASAAASALPQAKPGTTYDVIRKGIDFLAFNFGNAKNAGQK
jgi:hypothetical protein